MKKTLIGAEIGRWDIQQESGEWELTDYSESKLICKGGEAIVLKEDFGEFEAAVRVQVFDPFLFTERFEKDDVSFEIHLSKGRSLFIFLVSKNFEDFKPAKERESSKNGQIPFHKNVIRKFVNIELFHRKDEEKEDCLGWITIMEKADEILRALLKKEKTGLEERKKIANGILYGFEYLWQKCGISHQDRKLENFVLVNRVPKIIDFGLVSEDTGRSGYRKMGYTRRGSKYKITNALGKLLEKISLFQILKLLARQASQSMLK